MNYLIVQIIGDDVLFARFRMKRGQPAIEVASRETIDHEHHLASLLAAAAASPGREDERVILALPANRFFMREMELPISDRRKVREVLPLELKGEIPFEPDELLFDSQRLDGEKTLAVWARRPELEEMIAIMTASGLEPEIVTASMFGWRFLLPDEEGFGLTAITDGESLAVYKDGIPCFFRSLPEGETFQQLSKTLAALEIGKGMKVGKVFLHGSTAGLLAKGADVPAGFALLPINRRMKEVFSGDDTAARDLAGPFSVACSAALDEPVNFRSGDLSYTAGRKKAMKKLRLSMIMAASLLLLIVAETSVRYFLVKRDLDSVNSSISAIYREVFPKRKKPVDEVAELRSEIKQLGGGAPGGGVLPLLRDLANLKGNDVTGMYEVEIDGDQLRVRGDARSAEAVNAFRGRAASVFGNAEVGEIKSRPDGSVAFLFRGRVREGGR